MSEENSIEAIRKRLEELVANAAPDSFLKTQQEMYLTVLPVFGELLHKCATENRDMTEVYRSSSLLIAQMIFELIQKTVPMDNYQARIDNFNKLMIIISSATAGALEQKRVQHAQQETKH